MELLDQAGLYARLCNQQQLGAPGSCSTSG
jgi:hypothetical protein